MISAQLNTHKFFKLDVKTYTFKHFISSLFRLYLTPINPGIYNSTKNISNTTKSICPSHAS